MVRAAGRATVAVFAPVMARSWPGHGWKKRFPAREKPMGRTGVPGVTADHRDTGAGAAVSATGSTVSAGPC